MKQLLLYSVLSFFILESQAQDTVRNIEGGGYLFTIKNTIEAAPVENQYRSGTCWSFSALSFFESELNRMGNDVPNLSEMFVVWHTYRDKAEKAVRMHGEINFGPGGAFHDVMYVMDRYGIIPESAYSGLNYGTDKHVHGEMDDVLNAMVETVIENPNKELTTAWLGAIEGTLNAYLGALPDGYNGMNPKEYAESIGFKAEDYISLTSFTHHPFYSQFAIEVPDNWMWGLSYNLPLDELMEVTESALEGGYSVAWGADVSEKGFSFRDRLAIVPTDFEEIKVKGSDNQNFSDAGAEKESDVFDAPVEELVVDQELRQKAFDNYTTTDDHGMHLTGMATDQFGTPYFIVKNSWGTKYNDGYFFASEAYVRYKTINILVHKDAIPKGIRKKLNIK